jgi:hypothetical protein
MLRFSNAVLGLAKGSSAVLSANHANAGPGMYALAIMVGVLLGGCNAWTMYKVAGTVESRSEPYSDSLKEWCFRALYFAAGDVPELPHIRWSGWRSIWNAAVRGAALNSGEAIQRRNLTLEEAAHSGEEDGLTLHDRHIR